MAGSLYDLIDMADFCDRVKRPVILNLFSDIFSFKFLNSSIRLMFWASAAWIDFCSI